MVNTSLLLRVQLSSASMDLLGQFVTLGGIIEMQQHSAEGSRVALIVSSYLLSHKRGSMGCKQYLKLRLEGLDRQVLWGRQPI